MTGLGVALYWDIVPVVGLKARSLIETQLNSTVELS